MSNPVWIGPTILIDCASCATTTLTVLTLTNYIYVGQSVDLVITTLLLAGDRTIVRLYMSHLR